MGLDENSSLEQVQMSYSKLNTSSSGGAAAAAVASVDELVVDSDVEKNVHSECEQTDCNLDKLIRNLLKRKMFTITDSDRQEIRAKAYNLILSWCFKFL